jgi:hypothetical protein
MICGKTFNGQSWVMFGLLRLRRYLRSLATNNDYRGYRDDGPEEASRKGEATFFPHRCR